jgi:GNAT superfamily N-acetyltransferase
MRMYNFVRSRQLEGTYPGDPVTGAWVVTSLRVMKGWGSPAETDWPYDGDESHWPPQEPRDIDLRARESLVGAYRRARTIDDCRRLLAAGLPINLALRIDDSWFDSIDGVIAMPSSSPDLTHTVLLVGYDDGARRLLFRNSWRPDWGSRGDGYLPYDYFEAHQLEAWTITIPRSDPIPSRTGPILERIWGVPDPLGGLLHAVELIDLDANEMVAWSFAVEHGASLEIEELFVRPLWRGRGFGHLLASKARNLAVDRKRTLRAVIPHADDLSVARRTLATAGLSLKPSPVSWAGAIGE